MFFMRFMLGFSEAPSFPANARIVAARFPTKNVVLPPPSLTRRNISRWRSFRRCLAG